MEKGDLENQLAILLDKLNFHMVMFNNLLNVDSNREVHTPAILWTDDIGLDKKEVWDSILAKNHQLLTLSLQQEAFEYRKELAEKQGKPNFSVGVDYTVIGQGSNNLTGTDAIVFPMVGISIPLYRNKYKAMVNEVVFLQEAKGFEKTDQENFLETIMENGWNDYLDSNRRIDLYTSQLELAEQSLKLLETEYATSNTNFEEILRMERKQLQYGLELERARGDKQAAISFINYLMGT
jgi:outer membrane protein TolC